MDDRLKKQLDFALEIDINGKTIISLNPGEFFIEKTYLLLFNSTRLLPNPFKLRVLYLFIQ